MSLASDNPDRGENFESFEKIHSRELELQRQFENIEQAYVKISEKYKDYIECSSFVEYLRTVEKIFTEAKFRNWDATQTEEELIKSKMSILSNEGVISEDVLFAIYDDFKKAGSNISKINSIINELLQKYKDNPDCMEFITYIKYMFINFYESEKEGLSLGQLKQRLIRTKMEVLSSDGNPELMMLENIYKEFIDLINIKN